jgi:hypothetical protein
MHVWIHKYELDIFFVVVLCMLSDDIAWDALGITPLRSHI